MKSPQSVEIELWEELVSRSYAYLWHFAMAREKESARVMGESSRESWKAVKHKKQKHVYRQCVAYCGDEANRGLAKIWQKRADKLYAAGDFDGLLQMRQRIEIQTMAPAAYAELLQERHQQLQDEIAELRESTRQLRVSIIREKQTTAPRLL